MLGYTIAYTWSKTLDEGGDGFFGVEGGVPEDPYNPKGSVVRPASASRRLLLPTLSTSSPSAPASRSPLEPVCRLRHWQLAVERNPLRKVGTKRQRDCRGRYRHTGNGSTYERADLVGNPFQSGPIAGNPSCTPPTGPNANSPTVV
jgi:hypothetical protein